jgi:hypothetical protein
MCSRRLCALGNRIHLHRALSGQVASPPSNSGSIILWYKTAFGDKAGKPFTEIADGYIFALSAATNVPIPQSGESRREMTIPDCPLGQTVRLADRISALKLQAYRIENGESGAVCRLEDPDTLRWSNQVGPIEEVDDRDPVDQLTDSRNAKRSLSADIHLKDIW